MASKVYVGGVWPSEPFTDHSAQFQDLNDIIMDEGARPILPRPDESIDALPPNGFADAIRERIDSATGAIIVVSDSDNVAPVVESTMAAMLGKRQVVVWSVPTSMHRIWAGLPRLDVIKTPYSRGDLRSAVRRVLSEPFRD